MRVNTKSATHQLIYEDDNGVVYKTTETVPNYNGVETTYRPIDDVEVLEKNENSIVVRYLNESPKSTRLVYSERTEEQKKEIKKMEMLFDALLVQEKIYKGEYNKT